MHRPAARRQALHGRRLQARGDDPHAPLPRQVEGRYRIELRVEDHKVKRTVTAGGGEAAKPPPVVVATGDSTMQGVDNFLADELGDDATVRSDIRIGTGISKPDSDWQAIAKSQVKSTSRASPSCRSASTRASR